MHPHALLRTSQKPWPDDKEDALRSREATLPAAVAPHLASSDNFGEENRSKVCLSHSTGCACHPLDYSPLRSPYCNRTINPTRKDPTPPRGVLVEGPIQVCCDGHVVTQPTSSG